MNRLRKPAFKAVVVVMVLVLAAGCDKKLADDEPDYSSNLVHYFPFAGNGNDQVSGRVYDTHGVTYLSDRKGTESASAFFDGFSGYIDITAGLKEKEGTLSFWIFPCLCKENNPLFVKKNVDTDSFFGQYYVGYSEEGKVETSCRGKWNEETGVVIQANKWYHLVIRWDDASGVVDVFVNGKKVHTGQYTVNASMLPEDSAPAYLGKIHDKAQDGGGISTVYYKGKLDEVRFYNKWLPYDAIKKLFTE